MSPILVRPVREQLEHDRVIRLLQTRYKRRFAATMNPGAEQNLGVGDGPELIYPDLVLMPTGKGRKLAGVVEVETQESVNNLEAIAQWALLGRLPVEFALYVPAGSVESTRRLCVDHQIGVTEIWTYHTIGDQMRFTEVFKAPVEAKIAAARAAAAAVATERREAERVETAAKRAATRKSGAARKPPKSGRAGGRPGKTPANTRPAAAKAAAKARPKAAAKPAAKPRKR